MEALEIRYEELVKTFKLEGNKLFRLFKKRGWKEVSLKGNDSDGYCNIGWNGKVFMAHRIIYSLANQCDVDQSLYIDHINGTKDDNRPENLRLVTTRENQGNQWKHREGKLLGATWFKRDKKWQAKIVIGKTQIYLGTFNTELEASNAYCKASELIDQFVDSAQFRNLVNGLSVMYKGKVVKFII